MPVLSSSIACNNMSSSPPRRLGVQNPAHHYREVKKHLDAGRTFELVLFNNKDEQYQHSITFESKKGGSVQWAIDGADKGRFTESNNLGQEVGQLQKDSLKAMGAKSKPHPQNISVFVVEPYVW